MSIKMGLAMEHSSILGTLHERFDEILLSYLQVNPTSVLSSLGPMKLRTKVPRNRSC